METSANEYRRCSSALLQRSLLLWLSMLLVVLSSMGCRICLDTEDTAYPAYGGAWERTLRDQGRVGSLFSPAGARTSTLVDKDLPPQPDEIERTRDSARDDGRTDENQESDPFSDDAMDRERDENGEKSSDKDPMDLDAELSDDADDVDQELQRRRKQLKEMELQDIQVIPGEPLPPIL